MSKWPIFYSIASDPFSTNEQVTHFPHMSKWPIFHAWANDPFSTNEQLQSKWPTYPCLNWTWHLVIYYAKLNSKKVSTLVNLTHFFSSEFLEFSFLLEIKNKSTLCSRFFPNSCFTKWLKKTKKLERAEKMYFQAKLCKKMNETGICKKMFHFQCQTH